MLILVTTLNIKKAVKGHACKNIFKYNVQAVTVSACNFTSEVLKSPKVK
jgi:spore coat protein CotF